MKSMQQLTIKCVVVVLHVASIQMVTYLLTYACIVCTLNLSNLVMVIRLLNKGPIHI